MNLLMGLRGAARHSMRAYYLPAAAGIALAIAAFLPWVRVGADGFGGVPSLAGFWVLALGTLATVFAILSIITRRNSRHPLLLVGLTSLGIIFLAQQILIRSATERAWAAAKAMEIVEGTHTDVPPTHTGAGIYVGMGASIALVLFGLTIVVRRASQPYAVTEDDDV